MENEPDDSEHVGYFHEKPGESDETHVTHYLSYIGDCMRRFRINHEKGFSSESDFASKVLSPYLGIPVGRNRVSKAEKGDTGVRFGIYAAYFNEMGILPDILEALERGRPATLRYMKLVFQELSPEVKQARKEAERILKLRAEREKKWW